MYRRFKRLDLHLELSIVICHFFLRGARYSRSGILL
jgi:hypothetical protein